jgi:predicted metalloprotease
MTSLRSMGSSSDQGAQVAPNDRASSARYDTVAIYHDATRTIYLPEGWTGGTPAEVSVLVHEVVHHFQNVLGLKYECPQEREKLAYIAQDRWLGLFGHSLESDFHIDPFSLLVKTKCFY